MSHSKAKREQNLFKKTKNKKPNYVLNMKIFVSLARTVEDEKHDTTSTAGRRGGVGGWRSSQRRWVVKRPSPWPPEPRPEPIPGFGAMLPRGGGPLPSRSRSIPLPMMPLEPPGPRSLRLMSRRSSPPLRVSRSRTALVFFSSTFRRTSPRNMMGCKEERMINTQGGKRFCGSLLPIKGLRADHWCLCSL